LVAVVKLEVEEVFVVASLGMQLVELDTVGTELDIVDTVDIVGRQDTHKDRVVLLVLQLL
jgi:hypothetical protein